MFHNFIIQLFILIFSVYGNLIYSQISSVKTKSNKKIQINENNKFSNDSIKKYDDLYTKAEHCRNTGEYTRAIIYYNKLLNEIELAYSADSQQLFLVHYNLGYCYHILNNYEKALYCYDNALSYLSEENRYYSPKLYSDIAYNYYFLNDSVNAIKYFEIAIKSFNELKSSDQFLIAKVYEKYGFILLKYGDKINGEKYLLKSNKILEKILPSNHPALMVSYNYLGYYFYKADNFLKSAKYYHKVLAGYCKDLQNTDLLTSPDTNNLVIDKNFLYALKLKAKALYKEFLKKNNNQFLLSSLEHYSRFVYLIEKSRFYYLDEESSYALSDTYYRKTINDAIIACLTNYRIHPDEKNLESLYYYCQKAKASILYKSVVEFNNKYRAGVPEKIVEYEKKLDKNILLLKELNKNSKSQKIQDALFYCIERKSEVKSQINNLMSKNKALNYKLSTISFTEIYKNIKDDEVLLDYTIVDDSILLFGFVKNNYIFRVIQNDSIIKNKVEELTDYVSQPPDNDADYDDYRYNAQILYNILIKPFQNIIDNKRIVVVPDDYLSVLPFDALIDENDNFLFLKNPVSYIYSVGLKYNNLKPDKTKIEVGAFAPDYKNAIVKGISQLSYSSNEVLVLDSLFNTTKYIGNVATKKMFMQNAEKYSIIHIAAHTIIDEKDPFLSGILFTTETNKISDNLLYMYDLYELNFTNSLVFLAGCNTGRGKIHKGEGIINFVRTLLINGSRVIVFSFWDVNDKLGYEISKLFYENIHAGLPVDLALNKAKVDYYKHSVNLKRTPYYWATFNIVGDNNMIFKKQNNNIFIIFTVAFILFVIIVFVLQKKFKHFS